MRPPIGRIVWNQGKQGLRYCSRVLRYDAANTKSAIAAAAIGTTGQVLSDVPDTVVNIPAASSTDAARFQTPGSRASLWMGYLSNAENETLRYRELERKVVDITATVLTKRLHELESDSLIKRVRYNTIPTTVEYSLAECGGSLMPAPNFVYEWAESILDEGRKR